MGSNLVTPYIVCVLVGTLVFPPEQGPRTVGELHFIVCFAVVCGWDFYAAPRNYMPRYEARYAYSSYTQESS